MLVTSGNNAQSREVNGYEVRVTGPYFKMGGGRPSVTIDEVTYLDGRKRPLPNKYTVWIVKERKEVEW